MNYKPAELDRELLTQLQHFEHQLQQQTSDKIVIIAYEYEPDGTQKQQTNVSF
ncbi:hypothetical protein Back11_42320 [Paenibacillus baekrokdamisoli]|uniref:Uncharacterized protein n=1 Tax=Paenibacillus baekrokdamisoli TaxID=1712516 RepID=A0A3G9IVK9_9BACL|nr:hypothetical protein [Paenibacillus baekrokdamisoli]MBB3068069.1 hypothetical protein [Paenibacillus baekrokdamisoli]BBH22887.1 hypothetical protein Back11_42320 [Paenibacillus baekrokdamisoli]